jgi:hypothetical protein
VQCLLSSLGGMLRAGPPENIARFSSESMN